MDAQAKISITRGKFSGINAIADKNGIIDALAMDQRGSLRKAMENAKRSEVSAMELSMFKKTVTQVLSPYTSALLLDPEYALQAGK
jgi:tagatose 1,6-diphosphate aldolase